MSDDIEDVGEGEVPEISPEILAEAAEQGWVPMDQWQGKPEEWSDAETFVRRGREINPILRKALKKERERTSALETQLRAQGATVAELREYLSKVEERATANALASLKRARKDALASGDHEAAEEYSDQMDQLKQAPTAVPKPAQVQPNIIQHPDVAAWMARNPWFSDENEGMVDYANGATIKILQRQQASGETIVPGKVLDEVTQKVKKMFPQHFAKGEAPPASMFETGGSSSGSTRSASGARKTGFDGLPKSAQDQFKRFYDSGYYVDIKSGKKLDVASAKAEYFKEYE
jgi:hypothetical protein